jgi:hypothetical protein
MKQSTTGVFIYSGQINSTTLSFMVFAPKISFFCPAFYSQIVESSTIGAASSLPFSIPNISHLFLMNFKKHTLEQTPQQKTGQQKHTQLKNRAPLKLTK